MGEESAVPVGVVGASPGSQAAMNHGVIHPGLA